MHPPNAPLAERVRSFATRRGPLLSLLAAAIGCSSSASTDLASDAADDVPAVTDALGDDATDRDAVVADATIDSALGDDGAVTTDTKTGEAAADVLADTPTSDTPTAWKRDWTAHPALVDRAIGDTTYAISDAHGGYDRLAALLARHGIIAAVPSAPSAVQWKAGGATLVVAGDLIDKGPQPIEVIDVLRALQTSAAAAGGAVVVTLGNHEAEFLVDPNNSKATATDGVDVELARLGIAPATLASANDPRGRWLRELPFGVRVGSWFFSHAGDTHGRTFAALDAALRTAIDTGGYAASEIVGTTSILEARDSDWYGVDPSLPGAYTQALGVKHLVFGHQPGAIGAKGSIAVGAGGAIMRIDCGMSPDVDYSRGSILRVQHTAAEEVASELVWDGTIREVWRGAP